MDRWQYVLLMAGCLAITLPLELVLGARVRRHRRPSITRYRSSSLTRRPYPRAVPDLADIAPTFVDIAHRIVWVAVATVDTAGRPRTRVLHPVWEWDADAGTIVGWIATDPTSLKAKHLASNPHVSLTYWDSQHDHATAVCETTWCNDEASTRWLWHRFEQAPPPVGYDPRIIPSWASGLPNEHFGALRLDPVRLETFQVGAPPTVKTWTRPA